MAFAYLTALLFSLVPVLLAVTALAADEELVKHCRFTLEDQTFDICPILKAGKDSGGWTVESVRQTPPTVTKTVYKISLNGPLPRNESWSDQYQCPEGTWICMTMYNSRPGHEDERPRILQKVPVAGRIALPESALSAQEAEEGKTALNVTVQLSQYPKGDIRHRMLHVRYHGGSYVDLRQIADMQFICDHDAEEPSSPTFAYNWGGQHAFQWKSKHACGQTITNEPVDEPPPPADPADEEAPPSDNEEGDSEQLVDLPPYSNRTSRASWIMFLSSTAIVALVAYTAYNPPLPVRRRVIAFIRSRPSLTRFRVGENVLLRWAQEDMGYENDEEDLMVNGERDPIFFQDDEQIPLKPSPRKGLVPTYGSAAL
ncbi:hypothetical protein EUX98_g3214 [Antrodiella citrinella]|uniref:Uncharacterized protein n=1 Tax=Antrodiella citrinella TaxID=2447956 RepID=A0A4S4N591_9APHY|nr:hypothetical protein EUX98_g3214 [Antrodiella citrinella]